MSNNLSKPSDEVVIVGKWKNDFIEAYNRLVLGLKILFFVIVTPIVVWISSLIIGGLMK